MGALSEAADHPAAQGPRTAPEASHPPALASPYLPFHGLQSQKLCTQGTTSLWHSSQPLHLLGPC